MKQDKQVTMVVKAALEEYRDFQKSMFRKGKRHLWESCGQIHFYRSVIEYLHYCRNGCRRHWQVLQGRRQPIRAMWECYLRNEELGYATWQGIEEILGQMEAEEMKARCA